MGNKREDNNGEHAGNSRYDDELLSANWNPVIDLLAWSCGNTLSRVKEDASDAMSDSDIDAFLTRIYTHAT